MSVFPLQQSLVFRCSDYFPYWPFSIYFGSSYWKLTLRMTVKAKETKTDRKCINSLAWLSSWCVSVWTHCCLVCKTVIIGLMKCVLLNPSKDIPHEQRACPHLTSVCVCFRSCSPFFLCQGLRCFSPLNRRFFVCFVFHGRNFVSNSFFFQFAHQRDVLALRATLRESGLSSNPLKMVSHC